mmetsp:Transcript_39777/g.80169  ORF Transcript_39777/g.80169 Transcript_39777/m.80169 type:complete len:216 (-) Transcript_39777:156-803(-)
MLLLRPRSIPNSLQAVSRCCSAAAPSDRCGNSRSRACIIFTVSLCCCSSMPPSSGTEGTLTAALPSMSNPVLDFRLRYKFMWIPLTACMRISSASRGVYVAGALKARPRKASCFACLFAAIAGTLAVLNVDGAFVSKWFSLLALHSQRNSKTNNTSRPRNAAKPRWKLVSVLKEIKFVASFTRSVHACNCCFHMRRCIFCVAVLRFSLCRLGRWH